MQPYDQVIASSDFRNLRSILTTGCLSLAFVAATYVHYGDVLSPVSTPNIIRWLLIGTFFTLLVFHRVGLDSLLRAATGVVAPLLAVTVLILTNTDLPLVDGISHDGRVIEDFQFLFLVCGTATMAYSALKLMRQRYCLPALLAMFLSLIFLIIGMEEVSWFQRALEIDTPDYFLERNDQYEMNFHNIHTTKMEDVYYLGGFILLVATPYFKEQINNELSKLKYAKLSILLPDFWMLAPFSLMLAFVQQGQIAARSAPATMILGTILVLIGAILRQYANREWGSVFQHTLSLLIVITGVLFFSFYDYIARGGRPWFPKEYMEFYIAWGIAVFGLSLAMRIRNTNFEHET